jgi:hypothetical protein
MTPPPMAHPALAQRLQVLSKKATERIVVEFLPPRVCHVDADSILFVVIRILKSGTQRGYASSSKPVYHPPDLLNLVRTWY